MYMEYVSFVRERSVSKYQWGKSGYRAPNISTILKAIKKTTFSLELILMQHTYSVCQPKQHIHHKLQ